MKTKTYLLTLLVLIIHVVVISQPTNNAFQQDKNSVLGYTKYTEKEKDEFSNVDDPSELLLRADRLITKAATLKKESYFENEKVLSRPSDSTKELLREAETRKLAAAELIAYNNKIEFKLMKESLIESLYNYNQRDVEVILAKDYLLEAVRANRSAFHLREEAYSQVTSDGIIANLKHAEELETTSMIKIVNGMKLLEKLVPLDIGAR